MTCVPELFIRGRQTTSPSIYHPSCKFLCPSCMSVAGSVPIYSGGCGELECKTAVMALEQKQILAGIEPGVNVFKWVKCKALYYTHMLEVWDGAKCSVLYDFFFIFSCFPSTKHQYRFSSLGWQFQRGSDCSASNKRMWFLSLTYSMPFQASGIRYNTFSAHTVVLKHFNQAVTS